MTPPDRPRAEADWDDLDNEGCCFLYVIGMVCAIGVSVVLYMWLTR